MASSLYSLAVPNASHQVTNPTINRACGCKIDMHSSRGPDNVNSQQRIINFTTTMRTGHVNPRSHCVNGKYRLLQMKFGPTRPGVALLSIPAQGGTNSRNYTHQCSCRSDYSIRRKEDGHTPGGRKVVRFTTRVTISLCHAGCRKSRDSVATWRLRIPS